MSTASPPRQLGKYEISAEIARDTLGVTYRGRDPMLDAPVALSVLAPYLVQDVTFMAQFRQEMRRARGLKHPHILAIYDFGTDRDAAFLVTELVEGRPLAEQMVGGQPMEIDRALSIAEQVAGALDYAHGQGVIHQDLEPANILVGSNAHVTLTGFGMARAMHGTPMAASQAYGVVAYWSPEQAEGQPATAASDRYALAAIVFEMLTGRPPFVSETSLATLRQIVDKPAPAPSQLRAGLPPGVDAALSRALSKRVEERYPSAKDLVQALSRTSEAELPIGQLAQDTKALSVEGLGDHNPPLAEMEVLPEPLQASAPPVVPTIPSLPLLMEFQSECGSISTLCFNTPGTHLASGGNAGRVDIWMPSTKRRLRTLTADSPVLSLAFRSAMRLEGILQSGLAIAWQEYAVRIVVYDAKTPLMDAIWVSCQSGYDAAILAQLRDDKTDTVWLHQSLGSKLCVDRILETAGPSQPIAVSKWAQEPTAFIPEKDQKFNQKKPGQGQPGYLAVLNGDALEVHQFGYELVGGPGVGFYHRPETRRVAVLDHDSPVHSACFGADLEDLFTGCQDGTIRVWSRRDQLEREVVRGQDALVTKLQLVRDSCLVVAGADGGLKIWKLGKDPVVTHACRHDSGVTALAYHEGAKALASADDKGIIRLWQLP